MHQLLIKKILLAFALLFILSGVFGLFLLIRSNRVVDPPPTATPTYSKLVVIVQGIGTSLTTTEVSENGGYGGTSGFQPIEKSLRNRPEFQDARFMVYSYTYVSGNGDGRPNPYVCDATFDRSLSDDSLALRAQIDDYAGVHPGTGVYIAAHSLGGVVAFTYLSWLVEDQGSLALPNGGTLKGVVIMDSPLGGVIFDKGYNVGVFVRALPCGSWSGVALTTVRNLQALYSQTQGDTTQRGIDASVYYSLLHHGSGTYIRNEDVARTAMDKGLQLVIVSNEDDLLWRPDVCHIGSDFHSTEYEGELGTNDGGSVFVRSFQSGRLLCRDFIPKQANHGDVLGRSDVEQLIWEVFTQHKVDQLTPVFEV